MLLSETIFKISSQHLIFIWAYLCPSSIFRALGLNFCWTLQHLFFYFVILNISVEVPIFRLKWRAKKIVLFLQNSPEIYKNVFYPKMRKIGTCHIHSFLFAFRHHPLICYIIYVEFYTVSSRKQIAFLLFPKWRIFDTKVFSMVSQLFRHKFQEFPLMSCDQNHRLLLLLFVPETI